MNSRVFRQILPGVRHLTSPSRHPKKICAKTRVFSKDRVLNVDTVRAGEVLANLNAVWKDLYGPIIQQRGQNAPQDGELKPRRLHVPGKSALRRSNVRSSENGFKDLEKHGELIEDSSRIVKVEDSEPEERRGKLSSFLRRNPTLVKKFRTC
ncbi:uncharacterized protein LOC100907246 [Galendromus occidentalis]|uniref:Uncharacterized protein LOC100907246 n=1 Tax=Galendromus occidentalis TaxID=34638 RepID=A0AAJ6QWQ4_9ACAR|nr:uncharacterized protein LOC100907246 [Galendromus occidentalis]